MMQRLRAVLRHALFRRTLYLLAFGVGGYLVSADFVGFAPLRLGSVP